MIFIVVMSGKRQISNSGTDEIDLSTQPSTHGLIEYKDSLDEFVQDAHDLNA